MNNALFILFIVSALMLPNGGSAAEAKIKKQIGIGYFYSKGQFHNGDTLVINSLPFSIKLKRKRASLTFSSYLYRYQRKSLNTQLVQTEAGLGNHYLSFKQLFKSTYIFDYLDLEGKAKLPSNDLSDELVTSTLDVKISSTAYYYHSNNWFTATLAYRWRDGALRNTQLMGIGVSRTLSQGLSIGGRLLFESATQKESKPKLENTLYLQWKQSKKMTYSLYGVKGVTDLKLDWAAGLQIVYHW